MAVGAAPHRFGELGFSRGRFRPRAMFVRLSTADDAADEVTEACVGKPEATFRAMIVHDGLHLHVGDPAALPFGAKIGIADREALRAATVRQEPAAAAMNSSAAASAAGTKRPTVSLATNFKHVE